MKDVLLGFAIALSLAQAPAPPDAHQGQPATCANHGGIDASVHNCECQEQINCGVKAPEGTICKVYCRKNDCHCQPYGGNEEEGLCQPGEEEDDHS